jgi:hypothetical protein
MDKPTFLNLCTNVYPLCANDPKRDKQEGSVSVEIYVPNPYKPTEWLMIASVQEPLFLKVILKGISDPVSLYVGTTWVEDFDVANIDDVFRHINNIT